MVATKRKRNNQNKSKCIKIKTEEIQNLTEKINNLKQEDIQENEEIIESASDDSESDIDIEEKINPANYTLTKNEYLIYLYNHIFSRECDIPSLMRYIIMSLPGLSFEERIKILKDGPPISPYSTKDEAKQYVYARLNQYKSSQIYKNTKVPPNDPFNKNIYNDLHSYKYIHSENVERHKVRISTELDLT